MTGEAEGTQTLTIPTLSSEINCQKTQVTAGNINTAADASATLLYEECTALDIKTKAELAGCHIINTPTDFSLHITASALLLPVEFATGDFGLLFEKLVAKIVMLKGTECPVETKISGEACFLITPATNDTAKPLIESSETIQKSCPEVKLEGTGAVAKDKLFYGAGSVFHGESDSETNRGACRSCARSLITVTTTPS